MIIGIAVGMVSGFYAHTLLCEAKRPEIAKKIDSALKAAHSFVSHF